MGKRNKAAGIKGKKTLNYAIFFILIVGLVPRLYNIDSPYLDHHSWRQTHTAMIARNFYREGIDIFRPVVDYNGGDSVVEGEFPVTTSLAAAAYHLFGITSWAGRIVPIAFSILSILYLYLLIRLHTGELTALFSAFVYAVMPMNVFFSRVLMPESSVLFFMVASLYYFSLYLKEESMKNYLLASLFTALAFLSKQPSVMILIPLAFLYYEKYGLTPRYKELSVLVLPLLLFFCYYSYIHMVSDMKIVTFFERNAWATADLLKDRNFYTIMLARSATIFFTQIGAFLMVYGILINKEKIFNYWLFTVLLYIFSLATANYQHTYYQMPLLPVGAYFIGAAINDIYKKKLRAVSYICCILVAGLSIINTLPLFEMYALPSFEAAEKIKEITGPKTRIVTVMHREDIGPEVLYYADRKGWMILKDSLSESLIREYKEKGAEYAVIMSPVYLEEDMRDYFISRSVYLSNAFMISRL